MPNDHGIPDSLKELMSISADLLPATIISTTWPTPPVPPGMTLAAFATRGYVRDGPDLVYVDQPAQAMTLTGADGTYWVALTVDTFTDYAQWTRNYGSHYCWRPSSSQPADVDGLLVAIQLTVSGGAITAVTPIASRSTLAAAWRGLLALGTLATQNAAAVAITGGTLEGLTGVVLNGTGVEPGRLVVRDAPAGATSALRTQTVAGSGRYQLYCEGTAPNYLNGLLGIQTTSPAPPDLVRISHRKANQHALSIQPSDNDTGPGISVLFQNVSGTPVGSITTTATATSFNTSSDRRLKEAIEPLTDALATLHHLLPVRFRWTATGEPGVGLVADEVQRVVPQAVTGIPGALDAQGAIVPQGVDYSKLVPYLISALQALVQRVDALEAR